MEQSEFNQGEFDIKCDGIDWYAEGGVFNSASMIGLSSHYASRSMQDARALDEWEWREEMIESQKASGRWAVVAAVSGVFAAILSAASIVLSVFDLV